MLHNNISFYVAAVNLCPHSLFYCFAFLYIQEITRSDLVVSWTGVKNCRLLVYHTQLGQWCPTRAVRNSRGHVHVGTFSIRSKLVRSDNFINGFDSLFGFSTNTIASPERRINAFKCHCCIKPHCCWTKIIHQQCTKHRECFNSKQVYI